MPTAGHDVRSGVRVLGTPDMDDFLRLTAKDPVVNCFAAYRARTTGLEPRWLGGEMWGRYADGELVAACHVGANLVPVEATAEDATAFAERALAQTRSVSTIVGPQTPVRAFWRSVAVAWGRPRETRWQQPHLVIDSPPRVEADPRVRRTVREDTAQLYPACVAMYTEEVGVSPEAAGSPEMYRARVGQLIGRGWSFAGFDGDRLVFKAEVACATPEAAQIQGVYVVPDRRGEGLAAGGMAAVVRMIQADIAPVVSLYVNDWNVPARRAYEHVGFQETCRFATVMF